MSNTNFLTLVGFLIICNIGWLALYMVLLVKVHRLRRTLKTGMVLLLRHSRQIRSLSARIRTLSTRTVEAESDGPVPMFLKRQAQ